MKWKVAPSLFLICILCLLATCDGFAKKLKLDLYNAKKIEVSHILRGRKEAWTIDDSSKISDLAIWFDSLSLKLKKYPNGKSPGDNDGGEIYIFLTDIEKSSFSYINGGPNNCYILYDSQWYNVKNPTNPFDD